MICKVLVVVNIILIENVDIVKVVLDWIILFDGIEYCVDFVVGVVGVMLYLWLLDIGVDY